MSKEAKTIRDRVKRERFLWLRGERCEYCGHPLTLGTMTIDHQIPWAECRHNYQANFVLACGECNEAKGTYDGQFDLEKIRAHIGKIRGIDVFALWISNTTNTPMAEVLHSEVSTTALEERESKEALLRQIFGR